MILKMISRAIHQKKRLLKRMARPKKETQVLKNHLLQQVIDQKAIQVILVLMITTIRNKPSHQSNQRNMMIMMTMKTTILKKFQIQVVLLKLMRLSKYLRTLLKSFQVKSILTMTL